MNKFDLFNGETIVPKVRADRSVWKSKKHTFIFPRLIDSCSIYHIETEISDLPYVRTKTLTLNPYWHLDKSKNKILSTEAIVAVKFNIGDKVYTHTVDNNLRRHRKAYEIIEVDSDKRLVLKRMAKYD